MVARVRETSAKCQRLLDQAREIRLAVGASVLGQQLGLRTSIEEVVRELDDASGFADKVSNQHKRLHLMSDLKRLAATLMGKDSVVPTTAAFAEWRRDRPSLADALGGASEQDFTCRSLDDVDLSVDRTLKEWTRKIVPLSAIAPKQEEKQEGKEAMARFPYFSMGYNPPVRAAEYGGGARAEPEAPAAAAAAAAGGAAPAAAAAAAAAASAAAAAAAAEAAPQRSSALAPVAPGCIPRVVRN